MSWSTGSATGRACTWPCPAAGTANYAYCVTRSPAPPTPAKDRSLPRNSPGSRRLTPERAGLGPGAGRRLPTSRTRPERDAVAVLADVMSPRRQQFFPQRKPCAANSPTPTTSGRSGPSGTTWPAGRKPHRFEQSLRDSSPGGRRRRAQRPGVHLAVAVAARSRSSRARRGPGPPRRDRGPAR